MRLTRGVGVLLPLGEHPDKGLTLPRECVRAALDPADQPRVHSAPVSAECTQKFMISPMWPSRSGPSSGV